MRDKIKSRSSWLRKADIVDFYLSSFDFDAKEERFSINDIIANLSLIPERQTLEMEVKLNTEECEKVAKAILEDYKFKGKSIREWIEEIKDED